MAKQSASTTLAQVAIDSLKEFNETHGKAWDFGQNYSSEGTDLEVFFHNTLFPKIRETENIIQDLGNRFNRFNVEVPLIAQLSESYAIADSLPIDINLNKSGHIMLENHFRNIITKLYRNGTVRKSKFSINDYAMRERFSTLGDMVKFATKLYQKSISDINLLEEMETKSMMVDYALNHTREVRNVTNMEELVRTINLSVLNLQNNSSKYNEANTASGGAIARYTTVSKLKDIYIFTNDVVKEYLLNTVIANTYANSGLDLTSHIISFDDLGGTYRLTDDVTLTADSIPTLRYFGDYESEVGDVIYKGAVFTYDISKLTDFTGKIEEIKPTSDLFAWVLDIRSLRLRRNTNGMLQPKFYNPENSSYNYWLHYYQQKNISPFYNHITVMGTEQPTPPQQVEVVNSQLPVSGSVKINNSVDEPVNTKEVTP